MTSLSLPKGFLNGVRILDFTWYAVGPWGPRTLAPYGAEIIHIEPPHQVDDHRFDFRPARGRTVENQKVWEEEGSPPYYTAPYWSVLHNGKLAISLNTRHPEGMKLLEELIAKSDALVENFSGRVMDSWGLTIERLHEINPRLVYLSTAGFGHQGEWGGYRTFGPSAQAQSGLTFAAGLPDREPAGWGYSHMDIAGGWIGGTGLIMGLLQARRTGKGMHVDYAVTEAAMSLLGPYFLDYDVNGRPTQRPGFPPGNRSEWPAIAPHNAYRTAGADRQGQDWWVFIACETQAQWESLVEVMGKPELLTDPRFATMEARVANQDALDDIISTWTAPRRRYPIMTELQGRGVIAAAVQTAEDRVEHDPQLDHRGMYPMIQHPEIGEFQYERFPVNMSRTPPTNTLRSPMVREHEEYVYG
ncbi:MAG: CoA transferase, partial [Dehalococcoidia bacterium]